MTQPIRIGISFNDYKPGMKLWLHEEYKSIKKDTIVTIEEMSGFNKKSNTFKFPVGLGELFFITTDGVKIIWNDVELSCYIEKNHTTSFLDNMFEHYNEVAERYLQDPSYEWSQQDYNQYLVSKHENLVELILEYEYKRINKVKAST
ncbi:hypothetical protein ACQCVL_29990 [Bacillus thuringiensis]|uniref:hypothetical protein n=1 Tax=Bacillus thuringiensis TaxID=1428 RepID=UPI003CEE6203